MARPDSRLRVLSVRRFPRSRGRPYCSAHVTTDAHPPTAALRANARNRSSVSQPKGSVSRGPVGHIFDANNAHGGDSRTHRPPQPKRRDTRLIRVAQKSPWGETRPTRSRRASPHDPQTDFHCRPTTCEPTRSCSRRQDTRLDTSQSTWIAAAGGVRGAASASQPAPPKRSARLMRCFA